MKVKYIGKSFGVDSLTDGTEYDVVDIEKEIGAIRIIDDSEEDYLYNPVSPKPNGAKAAYGRFEVIEDNTNGDLKNAINGVFE